MRFTADDLVASVLYRDEAVLVINKPYGIAVHAGPKGGVTLDAFLPDLRFARRRNRSSRIGWIAKPRDASCSGETRRPCAGWARCFAMAS